MAALVKNGKAVLMPVDGSLPYDLVIDSDGKFIRIQCKAGWIVNGSIVFKTASQVGQTGQLEWRDYIGKADVFAVYCPETDKVYMIPVDECGRRNGILRVEPPKNNQAKHIRWAKDYEL